MAANGKAFRFTLLVIPLRLMLLRPRTKLRDFRRIAPSSRDEVVIFNLVSKFGYDDALRRLDYLTEPNSPIGWMVWREVTVKPVGCHPCRRVTVIPERT
jgi:hypothetical protein